MATSSDIEYLPLGFRSASTGTRLPMRVKSSSRSLTLADEAMASRCSTALVEPPSAMTTVMAFSKALRVMMSRGAMPRLSRFDHGRAGARAVFALLLGDGVLRRAVRQAHAERFDGGGHGVGGVHAAAGARAREWRVRSTNLSSLSEILPVRVRADRFEHGDDVAPVGARAESCRHRRTPPGGSAAPWPSGSRACSCRSRRWPRSRRSPGAPTTVSMESAMTSRDTSEYFMPCVPIEMPSETVMVLKMIALPPAASTPAGGLARELVDVHVAGRDLAPGRGDADLRLLEIARRRSPTACSMARLGACLTPSTTRRE